MWMGVCGVMDLGASPGQCEGTGLYILRQLRFSLYSGAVITEGRI